jgi:hypothetical protein
MTHSASPSRLGSEFDGFLFAPIGEERNGMLLTVLSALARQNVDPWQEAAELARLPGKTAIQRLASLIASLPDEPSTHRDPETIAARLISLLPGRSSPNIRSRKTLPDVAAPSSPSVINMIVINVIFAAFVLGTQWLVVSHQPPAEVDRAHVPASNTASAKTPTPNHGR